MPIYDYDCAACGRRFEVMHGVHAERPTTCPLCGKGPVRKAITAAAVHYRGSGWAKKERRAVPAGSRTGDDGGSGDGAAASSSTGDGGESSHGTDGGSKTSKAGSSKSSGRGGKSAGGGSSKTTEAGAKAPGD